MTLGALIVWVFIVLFLAALSIPDILTPANTFKWAKLWLIVGALGVFGLGLDAKRRQKRARRSDAPRG